MRSSIINVTLSGIRPVMFDRFPGSLRAVDALEPMEKLYEHNGQIVLPAENLMSFLSSQNTESAPQRIIGRSWKTIAKAALSFVNIEPMYIPFTRDGKTLTKDNAGIRIHTSVARVKKGPLAIPSPKERPVIDDPWELSFTVELFENRDLNESTLRKLFEEGGIAIGIGTYRGVFGKFIIKNWTKE